jgi:hypothetical protein
MYAENKSAANLPVRFQLFTSPNDQGGFYSIKASHYGMI